MGNTFWINRQSFYNAKTGEEVYIPDGVAHFLEHKMFEQENGKTV